MEQPSSGSLLIADPFLKDPNFSRTVILLCEHQPEGSFGFVINRPLGSTLAELLPDVTSLAIPVGYGGPVQQDTLHFLHDRPDLIAGSLPLSDGVFWGGEFSSILQLLTDGTLSERNIRFYLGYSGWGQGQLEKEQQENSWLVASATRTLIFHSHPDQLWKDAIRHLGGEYEQLINYPIDPQLN